MEFHETYSNIYDQSEVIHVEFYWGAVSIMTMTMTLDLFQLRAHEGQKIIGEILHTMIEHN